MDVAVLGAWLVASGRDQMVASDLGHGGFGLVQGTHRWVVQ